MLTSTKAELIKSLAVGAVVSGLNPEQLYEGLKVIEADPDHRFKLVTDAILSLEEEGYEMKVCLPSAEPSVGWFLEHIKVDQYWRASRLLLVWWYDNKPQADRVLDCQWRNKPAGEGVCLILGDEGLTCIPF